jgi:hypothetical protein
MASTQSTMIHNLHNEETATSRCEYLLAKHCPRLMRAGGGVGVVTYVQNGAHILTDAQRAEVARLGRAGAHYTAQIARMIGATHQAVRNELLRTGVKVPDGRGRVAA